MIVNTDSTYFHAALNKPKTKLMEWKNGNNNSNSIDNDEKKVFNAHAIIIRKRREREEKRDHSTGTGTHNTPTTSTQRREIMSKLKHQASAYQQEWNGNNKTTSKIP